MELIAFFPYVKDGHGNFELADAFQFDAFPEKLEFEVFFALRQDDDFHTIKIVTLYPQNREGMEIALVSNRGRPHTVLRKHEPVSIDVSTAGTYGIRLKVDDVTVSEYPIEVVKGDS